MVVDRESAKYEVQDVPRGPFQRVVAGLDSRRLDLVLAVDQVTDRSGLRLDSSKILHDVLDGLHRLLVASLLGLVVDPRDHLDDFVEVLDGRVDRDRRVQVSHLRALLNRPQVLEDEVIEVRLIIIGDGEGLGDK